MVLVLVLLLAHMAQQAPPRDAKPTASAGTAVIVGRVVDAETGVPIAGAQIDISAAGASQPRIESGPRGEFELKGLAAGSYTMFVRPPLLQATHLLQVVNNDFTTAATSGVVKPAFQLEDGQLHSVVVKLERAAVVEGRVLDEYGDPMAGLKISAERVDGSPFGHFGPPSYSDDRGLFRAFGIAPGAYRICATPSPNDRMGEPLGGALARLRYSKTCYPSATATAGDRVELSGMAEPPMLTIVMQRTGAFTIAGRATSESGDRTVSVSIMRRNGILDSSSIPIEVRNGNFISRGVPPGEYVISAHSGQVPTGANTSVSTERGATVVRVVDSDITGLELVTTKGATLRGRIVPEIPVPSKSSLRVVGIEPIERIPSQTDASPHAGVRSDLTFEVSGVREAYTWDVAGLPPEWVVTSVRYRGVDVTDKAVRFTSTNEATELEIVISPRSARVLARPVDGTGAPVASARVLMFRANSDRWIGGFDAAQRALADGRLEQPPVRPGEYRVMAIPAGESFQVGKDPALIAALKRMALRIVLAEGERRPLDLPVVSLADVR